MLDKFSFSGQTFDDIIHVGGEQMMKNAATFLVIVMGVGLLGCEREMPEEPGAYDPQTEAPPSALVVRTDPRVAEDQEVISDEAKKRAAGAAEEPAGPEPADEGEAATQPAATTRAATEPAGEGETATQPAGGGEAATKPAGEADTKPAPKAGAGTPVADW